MSTRASFPADHDVSTLFGTGVIAGLSDGELLERFVTRRDHSAELAFAALMQRHGPMVWGVCCRILNDPHAASDAFQATFLVLVKKASQVRIDDSLGRWLYGVCRRVATRARGTIARRRARERGPVERLPDPGPGPDRSELLSALDAEIARLPERYRSVVVLCELGGASHEEAARQLDCAVGTVGSRLSRARQRLRERLSRRGLALPAGVLAAWLPAETASASAGLPKALIAPTAHAARRIAAGEAASVSANVSALAKGALRAMFWDRVKPVAALALLATAGLSAIYLGVPSATNAQTASAKEDEPRHESSPRTAEQIVAKVASTYAGARSYVDEGEVTTVFTAPNATHTVKKPFSTHFVRPKLFRYEFTERAGDGGGERKRFVIWSDAAPERSRRWWSVDSKTVEAELAMSIGEATGISGGSSLTIPSLLMPAAVPAHPLIDLKDLKLDGEDMVGGSPCFKIAGKNARGDVETVWVEKTSSLVRRLFVQSSVPGAAVEQTTVYRPRLNVEVPLKHFEFEPPRS